MDCLHSCGSFLDTMSLVEADYCIQQINVPAKLPIILKQFCKSAIRTQPYDLLKWSTAYFHALAKGIDPPTKLRLEYPPVSNAHGLTLGYLKVLLRQLGVDYNKIILLKNIQTQWENLCLDARDFELVIRIGKFLQKCEIKKFMSIAVGLLTRCITETMIMICELFTYEPEGGSAMIPFRLFMEIYEYLAGLKCDGTPKDSDELVCVCAFNQLPYSESELKATDKPISKAKIVSKYYSIPEPVSVSIPEHPPEFESKIISDQPTEKMGVRIAPISEFNQDTETEVEFELDFISKEDIESRITFQSFGESFEGSFIYEGEESYRSSVHNSLMISRVSKIADKLDEKNKANESSEGTSNIEISSMSDDEKILSDDTSDESLQQLSDSFPNYPDVPGIGYQLLEEEVVAVGIWLAECSRRQEGIVGPRNLRHINCPPLAGTCQGSISLNSSSRTCRTQMEKK